MFPDIGPVMSMPSAWRGEATMSIPKRPMSKLAFPQALSSHSHPLQPAADTCRSFNDEPKIFLISFRASIAPARYSSCAFRSVHDEIFPRSRRRSCEDVEKVIVFSGHRRSQSPQNTHFPRSIESGLCEMAPTGQTSRHSVHLPHFEPSRAAAPGRVRVSPPLSRPGMAWYPWFFLIFNV